MSGILVSTDLDYLLPELRLMIGDTDPATYRYLDEWLKVALVDALKALQRWWRIRYVIDDTTYVVSRYANSLFSVAAPPVIMAADEKPLLLMASILVKSGVLQNNSWDIGTWRDAEIYVSSIEGGKIKEASIKFDWDMLMNYLMPPTKRLTAGVRSNFPGAQEYGPGKLTEGDS